MKQSALRLLKVKLFQTRQANTKNSGSTAPSILNIGTRQKCVASFRPRPLYLLFKSRHHPWKRDWGTSRTCPDIFQKEKSPYPGIDPQFLGSPDRSQIVILSPHGKAARMDNRVLDSYANCTAAHTIAKFVNVRANIYGCVKLQEKSKITNIFELLHQPNAQYYIYIYIYI
jgi:hypothetical protein